MSSFISILGAIVILGLLITVHELGHFWAARATGIAVDEFAIGFGPKLIKWRRKETEFSLRLIFLGGMCKFYGEDEDKDDPRAFNRQAVWKRILTVFSGPLMNILLAFVLIIALLFGIGVYTNIPTIGQLVEGGAASNAGLQVEDRILSVDGQPITDVNEVVEAVQGYTKAPLQIEVERDGKRIQISLTPTLDESSSKWLIGIYFGVEKQPLGFVDSVKYGAITLVDIVKQMLSFLKGLVFHGEGAGDMMGPVGTISYISQTTQQSMSKGFSEWLYQVIQLMVLISINLGIMNLLPIPALDGGRLLILFVEGIRRKPIDPNKEAIIHFGGFVLLIGVILVFTYRDILKLIQG